MKLQKKVTIIAALSALFHYGCSNSDTGADAGSGDAAVTADSMVVADAGVGTDTSVASDMAVADSAPPAPKYAAQTWIGEATGRFNYGPSAGADDQVATLALPLVTVRSQGDAKDLPTYKEKDDYILDFACTVYKWKGGQMANRNHGDAGKITITGHKTPDYLDAADLSKPATKFPSTLDCNRAEVATSGHFLYACNVPAQTLLLGELIGTDTKLTIAGAGGADFAAFQNKDVTLAPAIKVTSGLDLNQLDLSKLTSVEWEAATSNGPLPAAVILDITANLKDNSEFVNLSCAWPGALKKGTIPSDAMKLMPTATDTNPLTILGIIGSFNLQGAANATGNYVGTGFKSSFGMSCRTPTGNCPPPT